MFASKDSLLTRPSGYNIARSVRLRSSASASLNRTFVAGDTKTWTWSAWVKRGTMGAINQYLFALGSSQTYIIFNSDNIQVGFYSTNASTLYYTTTTQLFRDPAAWYHIVVAIDTTQATAANRNRLYINGVQVTAFSAATYPSQNDVGQINTAALHRIGSYDGSSNLFDGYMTEVNFVNAQQLTPSSFGETNAVTGVWQPKKYAGTYGTNGFYLNFSDNSTAAALGTDFSGNSNTWTVNNISVTAGATYDSMVDSPTVGSLSSNYAVLNPLDKGAGVVGAGNLSWQYTTASHAGVRASMDMLGGNWYFEGTYTAGGTAGSSAIGIALSTWSLATYAGDTGSWSYHANGNKYVNGTGSAYGATYTTGDVIGITFNSSTGTLTAYKNNASQGTIVSGLSVTSYFAAVSSYDSSAWAINFGQRPFSYTPPTGFVALNTYNLPAPTIKNGAAYMAATLYSGTGGTISPTNTVNSVSFQPDWVWIKVRSTTYDHNLFDSVRGVQNVLNSNQTYAENVSGAGDLTAFNSNGFTVRQTANYELSNASATYVAWQWKAGTTSASNTNGSITSTVSAGATQGFSVVTYTGTGANATVGHGLGVAPSMVIIKRRDTTSTWQVRHTSIAVASSIQLNSTAASASATTVWNSTAPTSTVFSIGTSTDVNASSGTYVAYCFSAVAGYSAFGSYTGNGSTDGPFVYLGFRPRFVMIKRYDTGNTGSWYMMDTSRNTSNLVVYKLMAESSVAENGGGESTSTNTIDILSNGFKLRSTNTNSNSSGGTYIYSCFAENPFKNSLAR
jgi:hypothetical protein